MVHAFHVLLSQPIDPWTSSNTNINPQRCNMMTNSFRNCLSEAEEGPDLSYIVWNYIDLRETGVGSRSWEITCGSYLDHGDPRLLTLSLIGGIRIYICLIVRGGGARLGWVPRWPVLWEYSTHTTIVNIPAPELLKYWPLISGHHVQAWSISKYELFSLSLLDWLEGRGLWKQNKWNTIDFVWHFTPILLNTHMYIQL